MKKEINSKDKLIKLFIVLLLSGAAFFSLYHDFTDRQEWQVILSDFKQINKKDWIRLQEVIQKINTDEATAYIELRIAGKVAIPWADNMGYKPKHFTLFIKPGDSIFKPANSDSIFIVRNNNQYHFILGKRLW